MAKDDKKDDAKPWTPDQPLPDEEDEKEAQVRAARSQRVKFLEDQISKPKKEDKKRSAW
jgi:hypothetical protein